MSAMNAVDKAINEPPTETYGSMTTPFPPRAGGGSTVADMNRNPSGKLRALEPKGIMGGGPTIAEMIGKDLGGAIGEPRDTAGPTPDIGPHTEPEIPSATTGKPHVYVDGKWVQVAPAAPSINPKERFGRAKPSMHFIPPAAIILESIVAALGAKKYGAFNWRTQPVNATTYTDAIFRHLSEYLDGDEVDPESKVTVLAHIRSCCAILIDAELNGVLIDDRHKSATQVNRKLIEALTIPIE
jgi:hypothetical protein